MADLIGAAGFEIECRRGRVHAGATALDIHVSGFGDELIFGPGGVVRSFRGAALFCLMSIFSEHRPIGRDVPAGDIRASCSRPLIGGRIMRLTDKVAIVTGGAHGMGEAEARLFTAEGATVIVADILESDAEIVAADIRAGGGDAAATKIDVTREPDWIDLIANVEASYGRL